jgi:hypothetical protein
MMAGRRSLRKIQLGRESTAGTEVNATDKWRGIGTILDNRRIDRVNEDIGIIGGTTRTNQPMKGGSLAMSQSPATFEQFLHILEASVKTTSPSQDGAGTDYIYTYAVPTTSGNTIKTYTIEGGDDAGEEQMLYSFVKDWTLEGSGRNGWNLSANWQGRSVEPGTFTSLSTLLAVNSMNFGMSKLYIDAIGGTIGTTVQANTLRGATIKYTSGIEAKDTADGRLDFSFAQGTDYVLTVNLEFEHDSISIAEKVKWRAETASLFRIKVEGTVAFATPGTIYSVPTLLLNLPGKWSNFEKIGEANGNDIVRGTFFSAYDTTAAVAASFVDVVELAAVP